jgi:thioesterase domain-containing protein
MPILVALRPHGYRPPLFLVHGRLGQALVSPHFLELLGEDQPVWAFQARGLDGLEAPHAAIEAMAADYLAEMRKLRPTGPYFLGALCAGALIAMAMARRLTDEGESVLPLLLLDPPERPFAMAKASMTEERLLARLKKKQLRRTIDAPVDDPVYAKASIRVARALERAIRAHRPQPYRGAVCMLSSRGRIEESSAMTELYGGKVTRYEVARTHRDILDAHNALFATQLSRCLEEIREIA